MIPMEKVAWMNLLYDFYGQLLTERQQRFIELYYSQDLSLGEIAEHFHISRQAVHDVIKRAEKTLRDYEDKLGLLGKFTAQRERLAEALELLKSSSDPHSRDAIKGVMDILMEVMDTDKA